MLHGKTNLQILQDLEEYVSGHMMAKKALISLLNRSKMRHYQKFAKGLDSKYLLTPSKMLLIGQSGTGKTFLVESLHKLIDFPLVRIDATKLNPQGASGGIKEEDVREMIEDEAKRYVQSKRAEHAEYCSREGAIDQTIVYVDEIDKLGHRTGSGGDWNAHVQANFLTLFDNKGEFDGVSFIFSGAFSSITRRVEKAQIGFSKQAEADKRKCLDEELIDSGLMPELVGRINLIAELDTFSQEDYYTMLMMRLLPKKRIDLSFMGVYNVDISEDRAREMAESAYKSGQGFRALHRLVEAEFIDAEFNCENETGYPALGCDTYEGDYEF